MTNHRTVESLDRRFTALGAMVLTSKLLGPVFGRPEQSEAPVPAGGGLIHVIAYLSKTCISEMAVAATALRKPAGDRSSLRQPEDAQSTLFGNNGMWEFLACLGLPELALRSVPAYGSLACCNSAYCSCRSAASAYCIFFRKLAGVSEVAFRNCRVSAL